MTVSFMRYEIRVVITMNSIYQILRLKNCLIQVRPFKIKRKGKYKNSKIMVKKNADPKTISQK